MTTNNTTLKIAEELRNMTAYERAVYEQAISGEEPELDYTKYEVMEDGYEGDDDYYCADFGLHIDMSECENI